MAANRLHLAVPAAITVALIIATMKGSMVASIFMHLSHEKKWIYGALLLTVVGFIILMTVPIFTVMDHDRHARTQRSASPRPASRSTDMSLRAFHLLFIALSVVLAAFCRRLVRSACIARRTRSVYVLGCGDVRSAAASA